MFKEKKIFGISLDLLGFSGSFLCAIHCLALPILVSLGALSHIHLHHTYTWEWILFAALLMIAIASLWTSFRSSHGDTRPLVIAFVGILLILIGIVGHEYFGHAVSGLGGLLLAGAHMINWMLMRRVRSAV